MENSHYSHYQKYQKDQMDNKYQKDHNMDASGDNSCRSRSYAGSMEEERIVNAENLNVDTTLQEVSCELKPGETLILDIGNNYFHQTDEIYDTLVMRGYEVKKSFKNGRNQIVVSKKA